MTTPIAISGVTDGLVVDVSGAANRVFLLKSGAGAAYTWTSGGGLVTMPEVSSGNPLTPAAISEDGLHIVGRQSTLGDAYRWSSATGYVVVAPGGTAPFATDVSADGNIIVGARTVGSEGCWHYNKGTATYTDIPSSANTIGAEIFVSADGTTVTGGQSSGDFWFWTSGGGTTTVSSKPVGYTASSVRVSGINRDGTKILVQLLHTSSGYYLPFVYDVGGATFTAAALPSGLVDTYNSNGSALSADMEVAGYTAFPDPYTNDRAAYTVGGVGTALAPHGDNTDSWVNCVSPDGSIVGGQSYGGTTTIATYWVADLPAADTNIEDTVDCQSALVADAFPWVIEILSAADSTSLTANIAASVVDSFSTRESTLIAFQLFAESTLDAAGDPAYTVALIHHVRDTLLALGIVSSTTAATIAVLEALVLTELVRGGWSVEALETATVEGAIVPAITALQSILDSLAASDDLAHSVRVVTVVPETLDIQDSLQAFLTILAEVADGAALFATVMLGGVEYSAYVMNAATKAVVEYENFPFNSFAEFPPRSGRYYGASDSGIHELAGTTDAGDEINAWVRTALTNMGTGKAKRMPSMYLGYTSSGALVLKVVTTSADGAKTEDWYEMTARTAVSPRENRIKIGRGLKSVFWAFEIHSKDGADFALDSIELFPLVLDRRLT